MYAIFLSYAFKKVARIKLGEMAATEIGDCLKSKSASQARKAGKASVNFGPKPFSGADNKKVKTVTVDGSAFDVSFLGKSACGRGKGCEGENRGNGDQFGEGGGLVEGGKYCEEVG